MSLRKAMTVAVAALLAATAGTGVAGAGEVARSAPGSPGGQQAPAASSQVLEPTVKTVRYGPFHLKGNPDGHHQERGLLREILSNRLKFDIERPCDDCFVVQAAPDLVYEDGGNANVDTGPMLHHMVLSRTGARDVSCPFAPQTATGQRMFASGNERTTRALPAGYGYRVKPGERWNMIYDLMTLSPDDKTVYITVDYHILPASAGLKELTPIWMDVGGCALPYYNVPAGTGQHVKSWEWTSTVSGRLIATGGHVHHGGHSTTLTNVTTGEVYCESIAKSGETPEYIDHHGNKEISSMSTCYGDPVGVIRKGDRLRITSTYNLTGHAHSGVMGIMIASVAQD